MRNSMRKIKPTAILNSSLVVLTLTLAGCFNEPEPAYKSVKEGQQVYYKERGLRTFAELPATELKLGAAIDYLNLDRNAITNMDGVAALTGLKWLRLNGNRLDALPDLKPLVNLRRVYLRDNGFKTVPETLKDLPSLTDVDLSGNPIEEIPAWLTQLPKLENVSFTRTALKKLPDDLSGWKRLTSLALGELQLSAEEMARIRKALPDTAIVF